MADDRIYDGHKFIFGMDADTDPSALNPTVSAKAVNRIFRGGKNYTRPPFVHHLYQFDPEAAKHEKLFREGNFQGWSTYRKRKPGRFDGIVVAIAGTIFFLTLVNERIYVQFIFKGNDPFLTHTWFCQAEEWLYIQNGKDSPIFWDGLFPSNARRADQTKNEMPIGTIMAYAHGRVFVSNAFDQIAASDIIYGSNITKSANTQLFTENTYWAEGGYFGQPTDLGHITGMIVMRRPGNLNGQGELVVLSENGAAAIDASVSRQAWGSTQIQAITLLGRGAVSSHSLINVNSDCWFRSDDGISSYSITQADNTNSFSFGKMSRQVNLWLDNDTPWLLQYASAIYFDNRILCTTAPYLEESPSIDYGVHYYHNGIVSLDLDKASRVPGDSDGNWDGLWTGIRPAALIKIGTRAFAFSYDSDGQNRIYEFVRDGIYDVIEGNNVKVGWQYLTKRFNFEQAGSTSFDIKKLVGGEIWISDVRNRISFSVDYRPDNKLGWKPLKSSYEFGSEFGDEWKFSQPRYMRANFDNVAETREPGAPYPDNRGAEFQVMVKGEGYVRVDRLRIGVSPIPDSNSNGGKCKEDDSKTALDNPPESDYTYDLAAHLTSR